MQVAVGVLPRARSTGAARAAGSGSADGGAPEPGAAVDAEATVAADWVLVGSTAASAARRRAAGRSNSRTRLRPRCTANQPGLAGVAALAAEGRSSWRRSRPTARRSRRRGGRRSVAGPSWRLVRRLGPGMPGAALGACGRARQPGVDLLGARGAGQHAAVGGDQRRGAGHAEALGQRDVAIDRVCSPRWTAPGRTVIMPARRRDGDPSRTRRRCLARAPADAARRSASGRCDRHVGQTLQLGFQPAAVRAVRIAEDRERTGTAAAHVLIASASGSAEVDAGQRVLALGGESRCAFMSYRWPNRKYWPLAST